MGRDVRDDDPVAVKIGRGNLLDAAELLALDRPVFRKIDLGPGQKVDAADAASACGRCLRLGRRRSALAEGFDVFTQNATMIARALDLAEIDAQFARQLAHRRAGIGERESFLRQRRRPPPFQRRWPARTQAATREAMSACKGAAAGCERQDDRALADLVAGLDLDLAHGARERRRHFHRRLVRLERDQRILRLHAVAGLDEDLDDRNVLEVADIGDPHLGDSSGCADRRRRSTDDRARLGLLGAGALELHNHRAFAHLVADLHDHRLHHAVARRRHLHGRLVGLQRNQGILGLHLVARLDEDLDHRDVLEVADVGNLDVDQTTHRSVLGSAGHTVQGAARPASILYLAMASATIAGLIAPSSASALSAATAT